MTLKELHTSLVESTGYNIFSVETLITIVKNCYADISSRGYKNFKEIIFNDKDFSYNRNGLLVVKKPIGLQRTIYCRVQFDNGMRIAKRLSLADPIIMTKETTDGLRTSLKTNQVVFYIKNSDIIVEWGDSTGNVTNIYLGYYSRLIPPQMSNDIQDLDIELDIRPEFAEAVVLYGVYATYQKHNSDNEKIDFSIRNYKYYVEDMGHELGYEDFYDSETEIRMEE